MANFHFITNWKIDAPVNQVYEIIKDSSKLSEWCPSVYLEVKTFGTGFSKRYRQESSFIYQKDICLIHCDGILRSLRLYPIKISARCLRRPGRERFMDLYRIIQWWM